MKMRTRMQIMVTIACVFVAVSAVWAGETPETIRIRKTMANDLSGHRRGDAELILSAYHKDFVGIVGHGNADPRAWTVAFEDLDAFSRALTRDLQASRYETERTLPFIHIRADKAMVTSVDSGRVVDRNSGAVRQVHIRRFWILRKVEDNWLIARLVEDCGDSALAVEANETAAPEIAEVLAGEASAWNAGDADAVTGFFDPRFTGIDAYGAARPESWKIIFSDAEELKAFAQFRLASTRYQVERSVLFITMGAGSTEAVTVTREHVRVTHGAGDAVHELSRNVLWMLTHRSGQWRISFMGYGVGLGD